MLSEQEAWEILNTAEQICSAVVVSEAVERMAREISTELAGRRPLVLPVMGGSVVFAGQLLPLLRFPLEFDYLHASRYRNTTQGGMIQWKVMPAVPLRERVVLVLDDILDEGETLAAIRERMLHEGVAAFYSAVLADKEIGRPKPISADFVGVKLPNRYVFGCGMDVKGAWRNLPGIYAVKEE
ncbi:MAG: hypoxanthine-guanine phosphoribosyltransferase [Pseudomonadota bacterium]